jgi:hypothetical protein
MKKINLILFSCLLITAGSCRSGINCNLMIRESLKELKAGNITSAVRLASSARKSCEGETGIYEKADSVIQIAERIALDFSLTEEQVNDQIEKRIGQVSAGERLNWEKKGWLECRSIDGKTMYFNRAVTNLILLKKFYEGKETGLSDEQKDPEMSLRLKHTTEAYRLSGNQGMPVMPVRMNITYTITVHPDVVPDGEIIRCWMPWPKSNHVRQTGVELLSTSNQEYFISPDTAIHSTFYMEERAKKGEATLFRISFRYQSGAQHFNLSDIKILPYIKESDDYRKYTAEQLPQISFSDNVRHLADSIAGEEKNPAVIMRKIYMWFKENIPWAGAQEYSIMPDIPGYVLQNRHGDCGMQTFLYMSMLRCKGIPVRWQSGWMVPPEAENLHDWCEVYFEGTGWVPSDVSYNLQKSGIKEIREYYLSGIDSYRLIINDGVAGNLYPGKEYMRSEPYDFQRGEVEWKGGNLYFDKWDYKINIEYLK